MHPQLPLSMPSTIDAWAPPQDGCCPIEWVRLPRADTARCFKLPAWISKKALERCVQGPLPAHRPANERVESERYQQIIFGVGIFGKFAFGQERLRVGETLQGNFRWSPGSPLGDRDNPQHDYAVLLCVTLKKVFNEDCVLLITLWEEQHDTVPGLDAANAQHVA